MAINTTLLFFLLLVPLSGLIALVGDRIGHRMGKKRHSLFGLRPRHTATLFTVGSGMGISCLTIALMYASSETFRDVLARGASLKRENRALETQNKALERGNADALARIGELKLGVSRAESEAKTAERASVEARKRKSEAEKRATDARKSLAQAEASLEADHQKLAGAGRSLAEAQSRVAAAKTRLEAATQEKIRAERVVAAAERRAKEARGEVTTAREKIAQAGRTFTKVTEFQSSRLASQRKEMSAQSARLTQQELRLAEQTKQLALRESELATQLDESKRQRAEFERLAGDLAELEKKRDDAQKAVLAAASSAQALRDGRITYRLGEEVARISLAPGGSVWRVQNNLEALLTAASKKAESRGAKPSVETGRAALIPARTLESGESVGEMDALSEASKSIRAANQDVVIVLVAGSNAIIGEPVPTDLKILRNPVVLRGGVTLGEIDLPNTRSRQDCADRLFAFLSGDIRNALLEAGVIPPTLGESVETSIVTLSGDEWLSLLESTRQFGSRVKVIVKVASDLRAADPVRLKFELRPLAAPILTDKRP